jgi:hypothetical protein
MMSVKKLVEWELAGETKLLGGNLPQCHFIRKSHLTWARTLGHHSVKPTTNCLSYGIAWN